MQMPTQDQIGSRPVRTNGAQSYEHTQPRRVDHLHVLIQVIWNKHNDPVYTPLRNRGKGRKGKGWGGGRSTVNNMILAVPVRRVTYCTWCRSLNILCNKKRSKGEEKNRWMRAERGDDATTVTDADEEKSPNNTCTTTWKREADVHHVKDVVSSYRQACHHDAQAWRSIKLKWKSIFFIII